MLEVKKAVVANVPCNSRPQMRIQNAVPFFVSACLWVCFCQLAPGDTTKRVPEADQLRFFENSIRPLLVNRCYECHAGEESEGGLRLDVAGALSKGGDSGAAVVPGKPDESLLVSAIRYEDLEMPPDEPLSDAEKLAIERWIETGAYWPIDREATQAAADEGPWWAAQPLDPGDTSIRTVDSPTVIDGYIDRKLSELGLHRAPPADRARLIRRLSYDLLGLPPTPEQIDDFCHDDRPDAYRRLVDRMFADPGYGERMARLWLDLVRFAESDGWRQDAFRPQAYRYRDWVINAFNSGMTFDQFVAYQLAGDEIAPGHDAAEAAAGFMRLGIYEYNQRDAEGQWQNIVDEITDVTADVFLATGMACAKCHDHKFDPISRADYYRFRSVFEPLVFIDRVPQQQIPENKRAEIDRLRKELAEVEDAARKSLGDAVVDKFPLNVQAMYNKPADQRTSYEQQIAYMVHRQKTDEGTSGGKLEKKIGKEGAERRKQIIADLRKLGFDPEPEPKLMTVADAPGPIRPTRLPGRGKGVAFNPAAPEIYGGTPLDTQDRDPSTRSTRRRTELARWITSPDNPVAARVLVNRLWQYHFGAGLVDSPNDFGRLGTLPSHPQLLDYLALRFSDNGWNIQVVQREIVLSDAYRQSAVHPQAERAMQIDSANRFLWHHAVRRLDAEQFRDSLLVAMGTLRSQYGGPSLPGAPPRRTLYLQRKRNSGDEMLLLLDAPPGIVGTAKRDVTTTAPQSLMLLNNERLTNVAKKFAERVRRDLGDDYSPVDFVNRAHLIVAGVPAPQEIVELLASSIGQEGLDEADMCHVLLNNNAFLFVE